MKIHPVPAADFELLKKYDTPTICNVVELFDLRSRTAGYMDHRIRAPSARQRQRGMARIAR